VQLAPGAPVYVRCDSSEPFVNPLVAAGSKKSAAEINATELNLNLGQSVVTRDNHKLVQTIRFLNKFLVSWWEKVLFKVWDSVPVAVRRKIQYVLWKIYLPLHKILLGRRTAIHPDASPEYHAMTTIMWGGRFFPVSVNRMRFALRQLTTWQPQGLESTRIENIQEQSDIQTAPVVQKDHLGIKGLYLHHRPNGQSNTPPTDYTLFWLYGGAFLAGDAPGNCGPANHVASQTGMDVFVPTYRLAPESDMNDILWDVVLSYRWLCRLRQHRGQDPSRIILFGCSSGAGLCARLLQFFAEHQRGEELLPSYIAPLLDGIVMPSGAILASPFCDFTEKEPDGSFHQYCKHDLIVNESVLEAGLPFLETHMNGHRVEHSPVNRSCEGLPPLCVLVSEHETVFDETCVLVNRCRAQGTRVTVGLWRYMCHVWVFLNGFTPEGTQAMDFMVEWIRELQKEGARDKKGEQS